MSIERIIDSISEYANVKQVMRPVASVGILALGHTVELAKLGDALGLIPTEHDKNGKVVWDIKASGAVHLEGQPVARSHTSEEFNWHTDASFEPIPPQYFMLQVLQADAMGGGVQSFIQVSNVIAELPEDVRATLTETEFIWKVPPEFQRSETSRHLPLLFGTNEGDLAFRYRRECIDLGCATMEQLYALECFEAMIRRAPQIRHTPAAGELAVVDNWRALHKRSEIKDRRRHLQRVRFQ
ncbi:hypothetical protein EYC58_04215 [Candidatus Saccharibacteria bacterium]|nr:MAG: hypothetical protein EYC58_04215 [Candidatus Saccharibacteria bacterium]